MNTNPEVMNFGYARNVGCTNSTTWKPGEGRALGLALRAEVESVARYLSRGIDGLRADFMALGHKQPGVLSSKTLDSFEVRWFGAPLTAGSAPRRTTAWRIALGLPRAR